MNKSLLNTVGAALAVLTMGLAAAPAQAQFPDRAITFIYPYAAGSGADTAWRVIGAEVSNILGVPVLHENRPGAGGRLGIDTTFQAEPDGYTISMFNNVVGVWQGLMDPTLAITPGVDYTPIIYGIETPLMLVARKDAPFDDLTTLIEYAKANPGVLNGSSAGVGSGGHLGLEMLNDKAGIDITHIPFQGQAPALTALLAGEVDLGFMDSPGKQYVDSGELKGIGVGAAERWAFVPQLPTLEEEGLADFVNVSWNGVTGPAGMPADVVKTLNDAYNQALQTPSVIEQLESAGWIIKGGTPQEFSDLITQGTATYKPIIEGAGITLQ